MMGSRVTTSPPALLVTFVVMTAVFGQISVTAAASEIVFNNLYHIEFSTSELRQFYRCLCNSVVRMCIAEYEFDDIRNSRYRYEVSDIDTEYLPESVDPANYGESFTCDTGAFTTKGAITCTRLARWESDCDYTHLREFFCRGFRVPTSDRRCSVDCVNLVWQVTSVDHSDFDSSYEPKPGSCSAEPSPFTTTIPTDGTTPRRPGVERPSQEPELPFTTTSAGDLSSGEEGENMKNDGVDDDDDGGGGNQAALGAGLACAFIVILVAVFVAGFILWRRRQRRRDGTPGKSEKPTLPPVSHPHANPYATYTPKRNDTPGSAVNAGFEYDVAVASSQSEYAAYLEPANIYAHIEDEDVTTATYENVGETGPGKSPGFDGVIGPSNEEGGSNARNSYGYSKATAETSPPQTAMDVGLHPGPYSLAAGISPAPGEDSQGKGEKKKRKDKKQKTAVGHEEATTGRRSNDTPGAAAVAGMNNGTPLFPPGHPMGDYTRLFAGRTGKGQEVSRSLLANYNNPPPPSAPPAEDEIYETLGQDLEKGGSPVQVTGNGTTIADYSLAQPTGGVL